MALPWERGLPQTPLIDRVEDMPIKMHFKSMHHWMRVGDADRAAIAARKLAHVIHLKWRRDELASAKADGAR